MSIVLYDLTGRDDRRFSPFCWRTRFALAHKGLAPELRRVRFTEIPGICGGGQKTVPVIDDAGRIVGDGPLIADALEDGYPDRPSLYGGPGGRAYARFMEAFIGTVNAPLFGMIVRDVWDHLQPEDQAYFRESREKRFGKSLEDIQAGRDDRVEAFRRTLQPVRQVLAAHPFLGGAAPLYPDYVLFGSLQWARVMSPLEILAADDPVRAWLNRILDLHGGIGRDVPAYWS